MSDGGRLGRMLLVGALPACAPSTPPDGEPAAEAVRVEGFAEVVPGEGLPAESDPMAANNNLDIAWVDGRLFLAWRTAPSHFASADTRLEIVSSTDEQTWRYEGTIAVGTDLREPQLVAAPDGLRLYMAELGTSSVDFEPGRMLMSRYEGPGSWTEPVQVYEDGFIPWRIKVRDDGSLIMSGYTGGENVYDLDGEPVQVHWVQSVDGDTWTPVADDDPVVLSGGGSETDWVWLDDGGILAVVRNEAGDEDGFGSKICTAPPDDLGTWTCDTDLRKYDSPLMLPGEGDRHWLVARRHVTETGHFDLGRDGLSLEERFLQYSVDYWQHPKRCAVWEVSASRREVTWVQDLPSNGDTCFPEAVPAPDGGWLLYNYSNDPDGPELTWLQGQTGETDIYRQVVHLP